MIIKLATSISAPLDRVFDLARSIDLHTHSTSWSHETAIAGVITGLIGKGEEVTWRARHFGFWQTLTVRVTEFDRPNHFTDVMVQGAFSKMEHQHYFDRCESGTLMRDEFSFESPFGILGKIVDVTLLSRYLRSLLVTRNRAIKEIAESDEWKKFI